MRYSNEIRVGIVFLGGLALIVFGYFYLRGLGLNAEFYTLRLNGAASIAQGNDVRLQGVKIGQVSEVNFDPETQQPILKDRRAPRRPVVQAAQKLRVFRPNFRFGRRKLR